MALRSSAQAARLILEHLLETMLVRVYTARDLTMSEGGNCAEQGYETERKNGRDFHYEAEFSRFG